MKNEYYHKLTELKKREPKKVELSLEDDLEKIDDKLIAIWEKANKNLDKASTIDDKLEKLQSEAKDIITKLEKDASNISKESDKGKSLLKKYKKAADDLGVKAEENQTYRTLNKRIDEIYKHSNTVKDWIRVTKKITTI